MSLTLKILRDPIWQAIGALIGVIAIFISITSAPSSGGDLSVVHWKKIKFSEYWLPGDRVKLLVQGSKQDLDKSIVDYFMITNTTGRPILDSDYTAPLEIQKGPSTKKILVVESCTKPFAKSCSVDGATPSGGTYVPFEWVSKGDKWMGVPSLLNPGDTSCVVIISENIESSPTNTAARVEWTARVKNVQLKVYGSSEDFAARTNKRWTDYLVTTVELGGTGVYWFVFLQSAFFFTVAFLAVQSRWINGLSTPNL